MQTKRRVATAVVAFSIAMGSGHFVQYGPTVHAGIAHFDGQDETGLGQKIVAIFATGDVETQHKAERTESGLPKEPDILSDSSFDGTVSRRPVPGTSPIGLPISDHDLNAFGISCDVTLTAQSKGLGISRLTYSSPCATKERVEFRYSGLEFTYRTDGTGHITFTIPILQGNQTVLAKAKSGDEQSVKLAMSNDSEIWHAALNWRGGSDMEIHAYELGARSGMPGHVLAGVRDDRSLGQIIRLGDSNLPGAAIAEVYGLPLLGDVPSGTVRLFVEATVTPSNCEKEVPARVWQKRGKGELTPVDVTVAIPSCDQIGETLMLKNLMRDLKLAAN